MSERAVFAFLGGLAMIAANAGEPPMSAERHAECEVIELHEFFEQWYRAELKPEAFGRFERALAEGFVIVNPSSSMLPRDAILEAVHAARGSDASARIRIENFVVRRREGDLLIATYEERQQLDGEPERARLSTVVLRADDSAPNGWVWLHVHETWMPAR